MILRSSILVHPSLSQNDSHVSFVTKFLGTGAQRHGRGTHAS